LGIHLVTLVAGDVMRERKRWLHRVVIVLLVTMVALAVIGGFSVATHGVAWLLRDATGDVIAW
jgi:hypothetical protein